MALPALGLSSAPGAAAGIRWWFQSRAVPEYGVVSQVDELQGAGSPPRNSPAETVQICLPGSLLWP